MDITFCVNYETHGASVAIRFIFVVDLLDKRPRHCDRVCIVDSKIQNQTDVPSVADKFPGNAYCWRCSPCG